MSGMTNGLDVAVVRVDLEHAIRRLCDLVSTRDPLVLLGRVATYIILGNPEEPKDSGGPSRSETNLEYLVSLVAARPRADGLPEPTPDDVPECIELLTKIQMLAGMCLLKIRSDASPADEALDDFSSAFRMEKLHVRGDGYWPHLRRTMLDLMRPHEEMLKATLGFFAEDYTGFMDRTENLVQERVRAELHALTPYFELVRPWFHKNREGQSECVDPAGWENFHRENAVELTAGKLRFDRFGDPEMFAFMAKSESEEAILRALSTECAENREFLGAKPEHAFFPLTSSGMDRRLILRFAGKCYAFNLAKLQRETYTLIGDLLRERAPDYWENTFLPARDLYLESEAARLFAQALPGADVWAGVSYPLANSDLTQADVVVSCGGVLLVVECKAARLDAATKRGAPKKIVSDLKETVAGGLEQAERFVRELRSRGVMEVRVGKAKTKVQLRAVSFARIIRVNVTLDLVSAAATELWKLEDLGLIASARNAWSVSLNDLRVIVEVLNQPAVFLHYLVRRLDTDLLRCVRANDELDYLMRYVTHGLFFRESNALAENQTLALLGYTEELDQYYRRVQGVSEKGEKPEVILGERTQRMIGVLATRRPENWLLASVALLEFDVPTRESLLKKIDDDHGPRLVDQGVDYALSVVASTESREALLLATSRSPQRARAMLVARAVRLCREQKLKEVTVLVGAWPGWDAEVIVCRIFDGGVETI